MSIALGPIASAHQALRHAWEGKYATVHSRTEAFPGQVDPTARNHSLRQWVFGEMKSGCSEADPEPRERESLGAC